MNLWCERLIGTGMRAGAGAGTSADASSVEHGVRLEVAASGLITAREQAPARPGDLRLGTAMPGAGNAHSHLFHRALRGRTHGFGGDFWRWRDEMYAEAARLTPDAYRRLAVAVFAEMLATGYTAVAEFHYVHHRPDGTAYPHEMERAVADAAAEVGIRLTLLDTAYLAGGVCREVSETQRRFSDGTAERYLERWYALREELPCLGAAVHSLRAVAPVDVARIATGLPADVPLHVHLSEQQQENVDVVAAYGVTPTRMLADLGVLSPRLSAVHATHLTDDDLGLLGDAGVSIVMCPTTEADLGDGIGPARRLADRGATIALGSDQNAVIDPFLEVRGLEMHERLASGRRGRFSPAELMDAATRGAYRSIGLGSHGLCVGDPCDLIELDTASMRTVGALPDELVLAATAADVRRVVVGGTVAAESGALADGRRPADLYLHAREGLR